MARDGRSNIQLNHAQSINRLAICETFLDQSIAVSHLHNSYVHVYTLMFSQSVRVRTKPFVSFLAIHLYLRFFLSLIKRLQSVSSFLGKHTGTESRWLVTYLYLFIDVWYFGTRFIAGIFLWFLMCCVALCCIFGMLLCGTFECVIIGKIYQNLWKAQTSYRTGSPKTHSTVFSQYKRWKTCSQQNSIPGRWGLVCFETFLLGSTILNSTLFIHGYDCRVICRWCLPDGSPLLHGGQKGHGNFGIIQRALEGCWFTKEVFQKSSA